MVIRIMIYICIIICVVVSEQVLDTDISKGPYAALLFFFVYIAMLYTSAKSNISKQKSYDEVQRYGFLFSFWIGVIWGGLMSFAAGFHHKIDIIVIVRMAVEYVIVGVLFGFLGRAVTKILWKHFLQGQK
jgi:hypothetical protein